MERTIALTTIHGSRLYGLAHANSDEDTYTAFLGLPKNFARQSISDKDDEFRLSLDKFLKMCDLGVPQALEAMFSPFAQMHPAWASFFRSYRMGSREAQMRYRRTIRNFSATENADGTYTARDDFKRRRHALRLCLNLSDGLRHGRFNPRLSTAQAEQITALASLDDERYMAETERMLGLALLGELRM